MIPEKVHKSYYKKKHICFENTQRRSPTIHIWCRIYLPIVKDGEWSCRLDHCSLHRNSSLQVVDDETVSAEKPHLQCSLIPLMHAVTVHYWAWWPWPLTYDLDLRTWPRYIHAWPTCQNSGLYVCLFGQDSETDGQTDTQTDTQTMPKLLHPPLTLAITPTADAGCNDV